MNLTGTPPSGISGTPGKEEDYTLDQLGNWPGLIQKAAGVTTLNQARARNKVNEIDTNDNDADGPGASITASVGANWVDPLYDKAGNMTLMAQPAAPTSSFTLKYDTRRLVREGATTIPVGVDDHVKSITRSYTGEGRLNGVRSYANADGTGTVRNDVAHSYGTHGEVIIGRQSHEGAVSGSSLSVSYGYDDTAVSNLLTNGLRLQTVTYPKTSRVIYSDYGTAEGIDDRLGRAVRYRATSSGGTVLTEYGYNGTSRLVIADYQVPDVKLDLYGGTTGTYAGFDRFGRTIDQRWVDYGASADADRVLYTYDYAGNRLTCDIPSTLYATNNLDQAYTYDGLHRLKTYDEGTLVGASISGTPGKEEDYTLDQLGNWPGYVKKAGGGTTLNQQRYHNAVNEIDGNAGNSITSTGGTPNWADPTHDLAGNMTTMPKPASPTSSFTLKYDA